MGSDGKVAWVIQSYSLEKPWGDETMWRSPNSVAVKTLTLKKGNRNSFKYNKLKDELLICASGKIRAYFGGEDLLKGLGDLEVADLGPGMALAVQSNCPYRLEGLEDAVVLEVSTKQLTETDTVRLHDDYGRETAASTNHMKKVIKKWFPI